MAEMRLKAIDDVILFVTLAVVCDESKERLVRLPPVRLAQIVFSEMLKRLRNNRKCPVRGRLSVSHVLCGLREVISNALQRQDVKREMLGPIVHDAESVAGKCGDSGKKMTMFIDIGWENEGMRFLLLGGRRGGTCACGSRAGSRAGPNHARQLEGSGGVANANSGLQAGRGSPRTCGSLW